MYCGGNVRVVACNRVLQDDFILWFVECAGFGPPVEMHLVDERALSDDGTDKIDGEGSVVCVRAENTTGPASDATECRGRLRP